MKKIILLSAIATHPQNAGHRTRIFHLLKDLNDLGNEVHFIYLHGKCQPLDADIAGMQKYWGPMFYKPIFHELANLKRRKGESVLKTQRECKIDDWYDDDFDAELRRIIDQIQPDVVFVEYIMLSKCLESFPSETLKVLDTHDIFTNRNAHLSKGNITYEELTPSFSEVDEKKALRRADVILAIQPDESSFFKKLSDKTVFTLGHRIRIEKPIKKKASTKKLLYVGSQSLVNKVSLEHFLKNIFPLIQQEEPDTTFTIAGNICKLHSVLPPKCSFVGYATDLKSLYDEADVVINPDVAATGLSIKSITAIGYSKPLVATEVGVRGLEFYGKGFTVAKSDQAFANEVVNLFRNPDIAAKRADEAYEFACALQSKIPRDSKTNSRALPKKRIDAPITIVSLPVSEAGCDKQRRIQENVCKATSIHNFFG
jgi:glycosyltransferase involved in cell wall biosynthesis